MGSPRNALLFVSLAGAIGVALPATLLLWVIWQQTVMAEEQRLTKLSEDLAAQTEHAIVDARALLEELNSQAFEPCSPHHLLTLQNEALSRVHVRAIGYWEAANRLCGAGLVQGQRLTPARASRIYDSGVIAWWPSAATTAGDVALFLMRFGNHDMAIDPRLLITPGQLEGKQVAVWVEGMQMAAYPEASVFPAPDELPEGLFVDRANNRVVSRVSVDSLFPIEVVAVQSFEDFWDRYRMLVIAVGGIGLVLITLWLGLVWRYLSRQLSLESSLRAAIDGGRIHAVYQPIVELRSGRCVGAEVLGRWTEKNGTAISPEIFVPLAEKAGLGTRLTLSILENLLQHMANWPEPEKEMVYHLNLTEQDLAQPGFSRRLGELLDEHGVAPERIALEITERALLDSDVIRQRVAELRDKGHSIAIDDFGTGYSSLAYLQKFELDTLKIDKTFVDSLQTEAVTSSVIRPIIDLARALDLEIIAEGIESGEQMQWLVERDVECGQGYWYSPALGESGFKAWYLDKAR
ncbi:EAL domain-containing protein [Wenzhouxiangella limi]|uniref:cyclic-guanylate-specific phosphodiesterase n=1 Tax=Wenzhouxiangella limi TaxID=2707351 RepID=A0A845UYY3_9GAMM|nr:EAL domain-containing protein [Wenzhouxiangella limi]NDY96617.1 EAL domain-containing protein [Wenzhouxiangella limi]